MVPIVQTTIPFFPSLHTGLLDFSPTLGPFLAPLASFYVAGSTRASQIALAFSLTEKLALSLGNINPLRNTIYTYLWWMNIYTLHLFLDAPQFLACRLGSHHLASETSGTSDDLIKFVTPYITIS